MYPLGGGAYLICSRFSPTVPPGDIAQLPNILSHLVINREDQGPYVPNGDTMLSKGSEIASAFQCIVPANAPCPPDATNKFMCCAILPPDVRLSLYFFKICLTVSYRHGTRVSTRKDRIPEGRINHLTFLPQM